jgi:hypothetical protein
MARAHPIVSILLAAALACGSDPDHKPAQAAVSAGDSAAPTSETPSNDAWAVRLDGIGPLRYGMPVAEVGEALHDTLGPPPPSDQCVWLVPASVPAGVRLMLEQGRLVRVDVDSADIRTERGGEVGMTEAELRSRYGGGLQVRPHKYDTAARYLIYQGPDDSSRRLVFETDRRQVIRYRGGVMPAVEYVEGCS